MLRPNFLFKNTRRHLSGPGVGGSPGTAGISQSFLDELIKRAKEATTKNTVAKAKSKGHPKTQYNNYKNRQNSKVYTKASPMVNNKNNTKDNRDNQRSSENRSQSQFNRRRFTSSKTPNEKKNDVVDMLSTGVTDAPSSFMRSVPSKNNRKPLKSRERRPQSSTRFPNPQPEYQYNISGNSDIDFNYKPSILSAVSVLPYYPSNIPHSGSSKILNLSMKVFEENNIPVSSFRPNTYKPEFSGSYTSIEGLKFFQDKNVELDLSKMEELIDINAKGSPGSEIKKAKATKDWSTNEAHLRDRVNKLPVDFDTKLKLYSVCTGQESVGNL